LPNNLVLIAINEFFEDSIVNFVDGKYSQIYKTKDIKKHGFGSVKSFIQFPEAIKVLEKDVLRKQELEKQLDVIISDDAELDSPPNLDEEIFDGSITILK
jgi:hypothetical protein